MIIYRNLSDLPTFKNAVITIGSFDGVHVGHQRILRRVVELAAQHHGTGIVITFDPHPRLVVYPADDTLYLLSSTDEKCRLLEAAGIDAVVLVRFTPEFSQQSPEDYIKNFLIKNFQPTHIVIGYDHHFGENRAGNIDFLRQFAPIYHYEVEEISRQDVDDIAVSSTKIRHALEVGDVETAADLLGYPFVLSGTVVKGQQLGRTIGYPTANLQPTTRHQLIPTDGIYAVWVDIAQKRYNGSLYIGTRPTVDAGLRRTIEVFIFDFNDDIYGQNIRLSLKKFIRPDKKLANLDELKQQIEQDNAQIEAALLAEVRYENK